MTEVSNILLANQTAYNVSKLLDSLLQDYDNSLRPDFAGNSVKCRALFKLSVRQTTNCSPYPGPSLLIEVNMQVRSMGPISEMDMVSGHWWSPLSSHPVLQSYIMDCYFRQSWVDKRLSFEGYKDPLALSIEMLRKIWKPDTYGSSSDTVIPWDGPTNSLSDRSLQREEILPPHNNDTKQICQVSILAWWVKMVKHGRLTLCFVSAIRKFVDRSYNDTNLILKTFITDIDRLFAFVFAKYFKMNWSNEYEIFLLDCFLTAECSTPRDWQSWRPASWTSRTFQWINRNVLSRLDRVSPRQCFVIKSLLSDHFWGKKWQSSHYKPIDENNWPKCQT